MCITYAVWLWYNIECMHLLYLSDQYFSILIDFYKNARFSSPKFVNKTVRDNPIERLSNSSNLRSAFSFYSNGRIMFSLYKCTQYVLFINCSFYNLFIHAFNCTHCVFKWSSSFPTVSSCCSLLQFWVQVLDELSLVWNLFPPTVEICHDIFHIIM